MRIKNNKGFTLVELIIAMSILSIVLALGYKVIIGTNKTTKHQTEVFSGQQNANLVNTYLTKDLEQVRKFTTADTNSNPYTYILNDGIEGIEKIEYEVTKTDDGKFYTVTRKTGSGSIDLISNYPTNSKVPFSINLVENTENLFKVTLNGKVKDNEISKYEFEVSSRVQNDVALVETPITSGGKPESGKPESGKPEGDSSQIQQSVIGGQIQVEFSHQGNNTNVKLIATSIKNKKLDGTHAEDISLFKSDMRSYHICAEIPIESDQLKVLLLKENVKENGSLKTVKLGDNNEVFGDDPTKWKALTYKLNNNKIYIYTDRFSTINNFSINGDLKEEQIEPNGTEYYDIVANGNMIKVEFDVEIQEGFKNSKSYVNVGFGEFNIETEDD